MARKRDPAEIETDNIIAKIEKRISKEYKQAEKGISEKLDDYWRRYRLKDEKWREWVANGKKTAEEYKQWKIGQLAMGKRWQEMKDTISHDLYNSNKIAKSIATGYRPEVYALNHNYATFEVEKGSLIDTSYTLYSRETVERLYRENPKILPAPGKKVSKDIAEGKAIRWNNQHIQSVVTQAILQGEPIPKIATRLAEKVCDSDRKAAIRNARTMMTSVQNAGRYDAYGRAKDLGIDMKIQWIATLDMRTRHSHRMLDGMQVDVGEPFELDDEAMGHVSIMYPGQLEPGESTDFPQSMIWNCRCALRGVVVGLEPRARKYRSTSALEGMTYQQWKESKKEKTNPIDLPEKKAKAIKGKYIKEYRDG